MENWLLFCLTETLLCAIPGPGVFLIVSLSLTRGARAGIIATLGVLCASIAYFLWASSGLVVTLQAFPGLFRVVKYLGSAYLVWLGVCLICGSLRSRAAETVQMISRSRLFVRGFATHGANPKILVYFTAILPQFVDPASPLDKQFLLLGLSAFVIQTLIFLMYSLVAGKTGKMAGSRFRTVVIRISGLFLVGAGILLVLST